MTKVESQMPPCLIGLLLALVAAPAVDAAQEPAAPDTLLFDTGSSRADSWNTSTLIARTGWKALPEDNLTHRFQGDAVALNDRLIVVLRAKGAGADDRDVARVVAAAARIDHALIFACYGWRSRSAACRSGNASEPGAIELRECLRNERRITGQFQYRVGDPAACAGEVDVCAIPKELPACALFVKPSPEDQPTLPHGRDINEAAEVSPGIGRLLPLEFHRRQPILN